jgi:hypothetical protein
MEVFESFLVDRKLMFQLAINEVLCATSFFVPQRQM